MPGKVVLTLVGLDGNAFSLMGAFQSAARRQGWSKEEIAVVMKDCRSGDYDHLLGVLLENTTPGEDEEGDDGDGDDEDDLDENDEDEACG